MARPAVFRLQNIRRSGGLYYTAVKGKLDPITIGLGILPEDVAARCLEALRQEDESGRLPWAMKLLKEEQVTVRGRKVPSREIFVEYLLSGSATVLEDVIGPPPKDYERMTIAEYYDDRYRKAREVSHPRTWRTEAVEWKRLLASPYANTRLKDVDRAGLFTYLNEMTKYDGKPSTWNMRRKQASIISWMFSFALDRGDFTGRMPEFPRNRGSTERTLEEPQPLTSDEVVRLVEAAPSTRYRALFAMCFALGMRPSEAVSMQWEDVDWNYETPSKLYKGTIFIRGAKVDASGERKTKTAKSKSLVPMLPMGRRELEAWWKEAGEPKEGIVFAARGKDGYALLKHRQTFKKALKTAAIKAGLLDKDGKGRRIFPYLGRHTTGTALIEAGVPIDTVAKLLRHTNPQMLRKHYDHTGAIHSPGLDLVPVYRPTAGSAPEEAPEEDDPDVDTSWVDLQK